MRITIRNCSSPGASFTENTNSVMIKCHNYICENNGSIMQFVDFRKRAGQAKGFNENNARNIFPLLKNCGFVQYEKNQPVVLNNFYTNRGKAYLKVLDAIGDIQNDEDFSKTQKEQAIKKLSSVKEDLIYSGLHDLLNYSNANYNQVFISFIKCLLEFDYMERDEFAYMLYELSRDDNNFIGNMRDNIKEHKQGLLEFEIEVEVRNDIAIREAQNKDHRKEGIGFLSSYNYFTALLSQAGLVFKDENGYSVYPPKREALQKLVED